MITDTRAAFSVLNRIARRQNRKVSTKEIQLLEATRERLWNSFLLLNSAAREVR